MPALDFFLKEMDPKGQNQSRNLLVKGFSQIRSDIVGVSKMSTLSHSMPWDWYIYLHENP